MMKTFKDLALGIFLLAFAVGCGQNEVAAPQAEVNSPEAGSERVDPLVILTWDEYFSDQVVADFEAAHGIPVEFVTFSNLDEMEGLLRSRPADFDLLVASGGVVADLIELEMLQPLRRDEIGGFGNLDEKFLGLKFDPSNQFSVPYMWGTTLVAYRSDKIEEPEKSWGSLWDERYRDRVVMIDDGFDAYAAALLASGHDLNAQDPAEIAEATELLLRQVEELGAQFIDIFEIRDRLVSGESWIGMTYSSDAAVLAEEEENIAYFIPEEGAPLWIDSFVIPRESNNSAAAHLFLEYLCRPEAAAANSNKLWSASANREARAFLTEEILEDPTLYLDEDTMARCKFDAQSSPERQALVNRGLRTIFEQMREVAARPRLSLLTWESYFSAEAIERFEKDTGIRVSVTEIENSEQLKQAIASKPGAYDVVIADEITLGELYDLRLIQGTDKTHPISTSWQGGELLLDVPSKHLAYSVPYLWGMTVLAGRREAVGDLEPSWNLLWREGLRVAVLDEPSEMIGIALLSLGYHPASATAEQIKEATEKVLARFPDLSSYMMDLMSGLDALEAGDIDLFVAYNGDAVLRGKSNPEIEVILPKEGGALWLDSFAIVRDAPNMDPARRFIAFMSDSAISALIAEELHYATPCADAKAILPRSLADDARLYPGGDLMQKFSFIEYSDEVQVELNRAVLRIITGRMDRSESDAEVAAGGDREG